MRPLAAALVAAALAGAFVAAPSSAPWPPGSDVRTLSPDGSAVGPLERHRVAGKFTVFDLYADWCGPCRLVDAYLRQVVAERRDVAVRKLNVVDFDSPLALEMGPDFETLPYLVVFSPSGRRTDILGFDRAGIDRALRPR
jgi:thiol-disulfide isomerase/thioredoxin